MDCIKATRPLTREDKRGFWAEGDCFFPEGDGLIIKKIGW